jgi:hypothetical protein
MKLKKTRLVFIFFLLVNIGQTAAQELEEQAPEEQTPLAQAPEARVSLAQEFEGKAPLIRKPFFKIGTGIGYSFTGYREETDLPLDRYVDTLSFKSNGNIEYYNFYYSYNFSFLTGETKPLEINNNDAYFIYSQKESTFFRLYIENALDYRLWGNSVLPGYLGCAMRGDFYYSALRESNYNSVTLLFSLNIHVTQKWIINEKNEFIFSFSIPFFGFALRPPYFGLYYSPLDADMDIISFHNYIAVFGDLKYYHHINKTLSLYLGLGFELSEINFPQPRNDASFCINAGVVFSF